MMVQEVLCHFRHCHTIYGFAWFRALHHIATLEAVEAV